MGTWDTLWARAGRRGAFLLFLAVLDWLVGYSLLTAPRAEKAALHTLIPVTWWAWAWLAAGTVLAVFAFRRRDFAAFALAAGLKTVWALDSARMWLAYHTPQGWVAPVIWVAFAAIVLLISSWPEPPPPPRVPPPPVIRPPP